MRRLVSGIVLVGIMMLTGCAANPSSTSASTPKPHGWYTVLNEQFKKDAPLGQIEQVYGRNMRGYANGRHDTTGKGIYAPEDVLSVKNGILDWYVHTSDGQPMTAAPLPQGGTGQTYGRWTIRFRSDKLPGYKLAFLLWPDSDKWTDGELDFPEGELGQEISGFAHDVTGNPAHNAFKFDTGETMTVWHTATLEWMPDHLTYTLDGKSKTVTDPKAIPHVNFHSVLQVETSLEGPPPAAEVAGHVQVDWIKIEGYNP